MTLTRREKGMCGVALAVVMLCLAVIRMSCSSDGVGSISIPTNKPTGKIVQPSANATPSAGAKIEHLGNPRPSVPR